MDLEASHASELSQYSGDPLEASRASRKPSLFPRLDASQASHALSKSHLSRPMSAAGDRNKTVVIPGFSSEKVADFWYERYGTPCPFFNALENVQVAPGGAGGGVGGSGVFALKPQGKSRTVKATTEVLKLAKGTGTTNAKRPKSGTKRRPVTAGSAGRRGRRIQPKLTLYDPGNVNEPIIVTNAKFRREGEKKSKVAEKLKKDLEDAERLGEGEIEYDDEDFENDDGPSSPNGQDSLISGLSERLRLLSTGAIPEDIANIKPKATDENVKTENQEEDKPLPLASDAAPVVETPVRNRPNLKLVLSEDMLSTAKKGLKKSGDERDGNVGEEPDAHSKLPSRPQYLPMSPLNLKSPMLLNALQKGKSKLRKSATPAEDSRGENRKSVVRIASNKSLGLSDNKKKEEEKKAASEKLVEVLKESVDASKLLVLDDVIVASNAYVYGTGRFGRVVKGVIRSKKIQKRQKSRFEKHKEASTRNLRAAEIEDRAEADIQVAVKQVLHRRSYLPPGLVETMIHEIEGLEKCAGQGVLGLVGVAVSPPQLSIVTQLFNKGSLHSLIRSSLWEKLEFKHKAKLFLDFAKGIENIHKVNVVHADIKSHNMLVNYDENTGVWSGVVGDLGSTVFLKSEDDLATKEQGTSGWTAPEVFTGEGYGPKADIFSFSMVLCDALCGGFSNPLVGIESDLYVERLRKGERPDLPEKDGTGLGQIIGFMWKYKPSVRPSSTQVRERLDSIAKSA